jgi:hypothetical protein
VPGYTTLVRIPRVRRDEPVVRGNGSGDSGGGQPVVVVNRGRSFLPFLTGILLVVVFLFLLGWVKDLLPGWGNPFTERTIDRSRPAVLKAVSNLGEYHAASGHFQVVVDVEKDTRFVPSFLKGERDLFVAVGDVDSVVDFDRLEEGDVTLSRDRRRATLRLPHARFDDVDVDPAKSYVYDRDRGLLDRVGAVFGEDANNDRKLYLLSEAKLRKAAGDHSGLLRRAETNTRLMLQGMLRSLGFTTVQVEFGPPET